MNKTAMITGASRGIGRAMAEVFAVAGYDLVLTCLHHIDELNALGRELENTHSVSCHCFAADAGDYQEISSLFTSLGSAVGHLGGGPHIAPDRGDIQDMSAPLGQHQRDGMFAGVKAAVQMGGQHSPPLLGCHVLQQAHMGDPGIVYQYVQPVYPGEQGTDLLVIPGIRRKAVAGKPLRKSWPPAAFRSMPLPAASSTQT